MKTILGIALAAMFLTPWAAPLPASEPDGVAIKVAPDHVDFLAGADLVARYQFGPDVAKPYIWPLNGPGGAPVTRAWPMVKGEAGESTDHVHQKSAWFCHGDVIPEGIDLKDKTKGVEGIDFWTEAKGHGRIVCVKVGEPQTEKDHGRITTKNEWRMADGTRIMDETRTLHFYDFGPTRLLVLDIDLEADVVPITFGDTKEGSMGVRVSDRIAEEKGKGKMENADGKVGEKLCWGQQSAWCDYSGPIEGKVVGIALLDDPANPYPACWHSRAYGLMAANPFGRDKSGFPAVKGQKDLVKLAKGEHLKLRYGVLIHPGDAKDGKVADYFQQFVKLKE